MEQKLLEVFKPIVSQVVLDMAIDRPYSPAYQNDIQLLKSLNEMSVTVDKIEPHVEIYLLHIKIPDEIMSCDLVIFAKALDMFCTYETMHEVEGKEFLIGDGDDSSAVVFKDGAFHIWVRHWPRMYR